MASAKSKLLIGSAVVIVTVTAIVLVQSLSRTKEPGLIIPDASGIQARVATKSGALSGKGAQLAEETESAAPQLAEASEPVSQEPFPATVHLYLGVPPGAVAVQPDGKIIIGASLSGFFVDEQSGVLGAYHRGAVRCQPDGTLDRGFFCQVNDSGACDPMRAHLGLQPDGRMFLTGLFNSVDGKPRPGYAMLRSDGRVDASFEPWRGTTNRPARTYLPGGVFPAALLSDGSVTVMSPSVDGPRAPFPWTTYQLDASGRPVKSGVGDPAALEFSRPSGLVLTLGPVGFWARKPVDWNHETPATKRKFYFPDGKQPPVTDLAFDQWNEAPTAMQAAVVLKALFEETPLEICRYAVRLPDGGVIMAVRDEVINGARSAGGRFMRFDEKWRPDLSFTNLYEADLGSCLTIKPQKDGKLLIAGLAGKLNGEDFPGLIRLEKDGSVDRTFHCETTEQITGDRVTDSLRRRVIGFAIQDDGRIVIAGFFTKVNGVERPHVARLNPDGSLDETFKTPFTTWEGLKAWRRVPVHRLSQSGLTAIAAPGTNVMASGAAPGASLQQTVLIASLEMQAGVAVIQYSGQARQIYILQAGDSLSSPRWSNISTNQAGASGAGIFRDEEAIKHSMRFYRIASP